MDKKVANKVVKDLIVKTTKEMGIKDADLAETLGVSRSRISEWKNGHVVPSVAYLCEIAAISGREVSFKKSRS